MIRQILADFVVNYYSVPRHEDINTVNMLPKELPVTRSHHPPRSVIRHDGGKSRTPEDEPRYDTSCGNHSATKTKKSQSPQILLASTVAGAARHGKSAENIYAQGRQATLKVVYTESRGRGSCLTRRDRFSIKWKRPTSGPIMPHAVARICDLQPVIRSLADRRGSADKRALATTKL